MVRQHLIAFLYFFCLSSVALAKVSSDNTLVIPSGNIEVKPVEPTTPENVTTERDGLLMGKMRPVPYTPPAYHLEPRPSLTLALGRAYDTHADDHTGWLGAHLAPWMTATTRTQIGLEMRDGVGWWQLAFHHLPSRNLSRVYWGAGVSLLADSREELRPVLRLRNYYGFLSGGWELQLLKRQNLRLEASYHQGTERGLVKATLGYTFSF